MVPFPAMPIGAVLARSIATNVPFAAAIVAAFGGISALLKWTPASERRRAFLRTLAANDDCDDRLLLAFIDSQDPIEKARRLLADSETAPAPRLALRKALAASL